MYKWEKTFVVPEGTEIRKSFIEAIFNILNEGTIYTDVNGRFTGYINAMEGPLGTIHFMSDHSLEYDDNYRFIIIRVIYLDKKVLYFKIVEDSLVVYEFKNGHWANKVQNFNRGVI